MNMFDTHGKLQELGGWTISISGNVRIRVKILQFTIAKHCIHQN